MPGMLLASLFPAIIGTQFPGAVYVSQSLSFRSPAAVSGARDPSERGVLQHTHTIAARPLTWLLPPLACKPSHAARPKPLLHHECRWAKRSRPR